MPSAALYVVVITLALGFESYSAHHLLRFLDFLPSCGGPAFKSDERTLTQRET